MATVLCPTSRNQIFNYFITSKCLTPVGPKCLIFLVERAFSHCDVTCDVDYKLWTVWISMSPVWRSIIFTFSSHGLVEVLFKMDCDQISLNDSHVYLFYYYLIPKSYSLSIEHTHYLGVWRTRREIGICASSKHENRAWWGSEKREMYIDNRCRSYGSLQTGPHD